MKKAYLIRIGIITIIGILAILAIFGFMYPVKIMNLQFGAVFEKVFVDFSIPALIILLGLVAFTFVFGRLYCSTICPFGILQEGFDILYKKIAKKKKKNPPQKNYKYKYIGAFVVFSVLIGGSTVLIKYIDPYTIFSNAFSFSILGIILSIAVIVLVFFKNRFFCTNICPVGAILGLISKFSILKINMDKSSCVACGVCARSCPSGCIDIKENTIDNEICIKCLKCVRVCPQNAITYSKNQEKIEIPKFNKTRREALIGLGAISVFTALVGVGVACSKNIAKKIKNIILPPGSVDARRMFNKCLNCNLCINNCPTKILSKANKDFGAVHIDYSKGDGYCEFECNNCSKVCPSGAIKRLPLEEKQLTRIAMATIKKEACKRCGICVNECPMQAITIENDSCSIDGLRCIGCGKCKTVCKSNAIEIFPINKQTSI